MLLLLSINVLTRENITLFAHRPRPHQWAAHGARWLACGGAVLPATAANSSPATAANTTTALDQRDSHALRHNSTRDTWHMNRATTGQLLRVNMWETGDYIEWICERRLITLNRYVRDGWLLEAVFSVGLLRGIFDTIFWETADFESKIWADEKMTALAGWPGGTAHNGIKYCGFFLS